MKNRVIEIDEIKEIIPHRYPMLLLDRVIELTDTSIKGIKNVTANEQFFMGHFPEYPVMPGVLIVEALAQVSGIYGIELLKERGTYKEGLKTFFTSIDKVKFKRPVRPGDQLVLESHYIQDKLNVFWFKTQALVDGKVAVEAELSAALRP